MRPDTFTNTPEDAAAYERLRGMDEWIDNRPTAAELADDGPLGPIVTGWRCPSCGTRHRDGDPFDGCPGCGHVVGAA